MALGKVNRKELTLIADVLPMQYDLVIKRTLREAHGRICPQRATFPMLKQSNLSGPSYARHKANTGNDTALCFVLRAVNRILSDKDQPDRVTISRLWEVLDEP